jgi:hypothetical protein
MWSLKPSPNCVLQGIIPAPAQEIARQTQRDAPQPNNKHFVVAAVARAEPPQHLLHEFSLFVFHQQHDGWVTDCPRNHFETACKESIHEGMPPTKMLTSTICMQVDKLHGLRQALDLRLQPHHSSWTQEELPG